MIAAADDDGVLTHSLTLFFTFLPDLMKNKIFTWSDFSLLSTLKQKKMQVYSKSPSLSMEDQHYNDPPYLGYRF